MSREWKPGDVAMLMCKDGQERIAILTDRGDLAPLWIASGPEWGRLSEIEARPLVVIDPEDRETFRRALEEWTRHAFGYTATPGDCARFADALRGLIEPPKPEEPTGLGAVVEDVDGRTWVRVEPAHADVSPWSPTWSVLGDDAQPSEYADIAAVKVLSQGVSADV